MTLLQYIFRLNIFELKFKNVHIIHIGVQNLLSFTYIKKSVQNNDAYPWNVHRKSSAYITGVLLSYGHENRNIFFRANLNFTTVCTGCERYWRPFFDANINLHKTFKNDNRLMKLSGIVYLYLDFTFRGWNRL